MKEFLTCTIGLLRKYKRLWVVNTAFVAIFLIGILSILFAQPELIVCCFFLLIMISWEMSDVFLFEKQSVLQTELADAQDNLIVKEHEVERLTLELEIAKAELGIVKEAFKEGEKQWEQAAKKTKETVNQTEDTPSVTEQKPKPKRKPAPRGTRKPKTKNENKD